MKKTALLTAITCSLLHPGKATSDTFPVTIGNDPGHGLTANTLSWAILQANTNPGPDTIELQTDVTVTGVMKRLIDSDVTLSSDNTRRSISGNNQYRPLFIKSGNVTIQNLNIENGSAQGGASGLGGSGAGMGGGIFIYAGTVNIHNTTLSNNQVSGQMRDSTLNGGGGGIFGSGVQNGGGLFGHATFSAIGYGGYGLYQNNDPAFGQGGLKSPDRYQPGTSGGFGGGGGFGNYTAGSNGGFGGGGGATYNYGYVYNPKPHIYSGGHGGFGAGGGRAWWSNNHGQAGFGGHINLAAGLGGALFIRSGQVTINNSHFANNHAKQTIDGQNASSGYGGGIFILHSLNNTNGNNQGMPDSLPDVGFCGVTFENNLADTQGALQNNNNDIFDVGDRITNLCPDPDININANGHEIPDGDDTPSTADHTGFGQAQSSIESITRTFTITNTMFEPLLLSGQSAIHLNNPSGQFQITQQPLTTTLGFEESVTFEVTFTPTSLGVDQATIIIENNDPDENPFDFVIEGEGIAPQPELQVTYQGMIIDSGDETPSLSDGTDFGYVPVANGMVEHTFLIQNTGHATLNFSNQENSIQVISANNSMDMASQLDQFELQPNQSLPFTVAFDPDHVGLSLNNHVNIASNDPNHPTHSFRISGYGQATMQLNGLNTDIQEGENLQFEVITDLPVSEYTVVQYALFGEVDELDFPLAPIAGQFIFQPGLQSQILEFYAQQDGSYEGPEQLSFAILSEDPAINQTTPFIISGSLDDDVIFHHGFEPLTLNQISNKLNQNHKETVAWCHSMTGTCHFMGEAFNLNNIPANERPAQYIHLINEWINNNLPTGDWDADGVLNAEDESPTGLK